MSFPFAFAWLNALHAVRHSHTEYISLSQALRETIPLATLMREVNEIFPLYLPRPRFIIKVWEDNQSCIAMAENPKFTPRTKHIAIKYHHFRKHVITQANSEGFILLEYCSTHDQIADIFTKPVRDDIFFKLRKSFMGWWLDVYHVMRECEIIGDLAYYLAHTVSRYRYLATVLLYLRTCSLFGFKPQQEGFLDSLGI